ncbi:MAG: valine--tRNA ligase [Chloroflexi bacterium]|nr:valine--tRNA ligase [Chloroflexota bacterium]
MADEQMSKVYQPAAVEARTYERWLAADVFAPDGVGARNDPAKPPFVIIQPPPNVTGALHLGQALTASLEDAMVRRARMQGRPTLWLPGVDHASIAAQVVLDGIIAAEGETRHSLGRERYLERMWRFMDETRDIIGHQHRRLGASVDWGRLRFTMDDVSARAVRTSFKQLYDDGLAYRGERLINWCPGCRTSLSDLEVIATPETGTLWSIRYHLLDDRGIPLPSDTITVATTRPETILGDTAVAVHPDDERYRMLVGRRVLIPLVDRIVPVIADTMVERDFGTGAVKVTPAHDQADLETAERHDLPMVEVMDDDARINENGGPYRGLTREEARTRIVADLEKAGDLVEARPHSMVIGRCQRSDDIAEPRLKTQWFVRTQPMAALAMEAVRQGRTRIVPQRLEKVFFDWMENIRDWNISRQLWWGHRIPAWYCPDGHVTVTDVAEGPSACGTCGRPSAELEQDEDIFDTWFSSGLWPFSTLGWPEATEDLRRYYPGTVMETGYDILFFWVARMMMLGEWLMAREPFSVVYLHGMVRDPYGAKMSKSRRNVVDPLSVVDEVGADALRLALIGSTAPGADQRLVRSQLDGARNFGNKLWNAARFVVGARPSAVDREDRLELPAPAELGPADRWILHRCALTVAAADRAYDAFLFGEAARTLHDDIRTDFCDWYLEIAKVQLRSGDAVQQRSTWQVLAYVLDRYLRRLHPIMPHITEESWARLPHEHGDWELLIISPWRDTGAAERRVDESEAAGVAALIDLISGIRNARAEAGIEPAVRLPAILRLSDPGARAAYRPLAAAVGHLARVDVTLVDDQTELDVMAGGLTVITPAGEARIARGAADVERELERLARDLASAQKRLAEVRARLADERFLARAPAAVIDGTRTSALQLQERVERLTDRLTDVPSS